MRTKAEYYSRSPLGGMYDGTTIDTHHSAEETEWGLLVTIEHAVQKNRRAPDENEAAEFSYMCEYEIAPTPIVNLMEAVPEDHRPRVALAILADLAAWVRNSPGDRVGDAADHLLVLFKQRYPETT